MQIGDTMFLAALLFIYRRSYRYKYNSSDLMRGYLDENRTCDDLWPLFPTKWQQPLRDCTTNNVHVYVNYKTSHYRSVQKRRHLLLERCYLLGGYCLCIVRFFLIASRMCQRIQQVRVGWKRISSAKDLDEIWIRTRVVSEGKLAFNLDKL